MKEPGEPKFSELSSEEQRQKRMEDQLYVARDIEGEPNTEELKIIRQLEKELSGEEEFIGVAPHGSVVTGYSVDTSDIDLMVLYSKSYKDNFKAANIEIVIKQACSRLGKKEGIDINPETVGVDLELVLHDIKRSFEEDRMNIFPRRVLSVLSRMTIGGKVDEYRKALTEELHKLTKEQQEEVVEDIVNDLFQRDCASYRKRRERLPEVGEGNVVAIDQRKELWEKRVRKIWGIEKQ